MGVSLGSSDDVRSQHQPYMGHPGFKFGPKPSVILRSTSAGTSSGAARAAAMAAAATANPFILPSRLGPMPIGVGRRVDESRRSGMRFMNDGGALAVDNGGLLGAPNDRLRFVGPHARSEGDSDAVMAV
ncbi:hypothetical protein PHYPSEUDO_013772 [Phytophthora pseudosyringae]|uniref:Uncharacterized protein n=1 Tax=Phytophthora pseudosyringae TaxID=221518 RepID=A0A8T1V4Y6_9STRA|nr:hypothetical protein PHYPSEUDO_013772 [Phytophthora pseudosyringae]